MTVFLMTITTDPLSSTKCQLFFEKRTSETVNESDNATGNNESARPQTQNSRKQVGPSSPSGVTEQEVTKELANALPQDTGTSSTNGDAMPRTKTGEVLSLVWL